MKAKKLKADLSVHNYYVVRHNGRKIVGVLLQQLDLEFTMTINDTRERNIK